MPQTIKSVERKLDALNFFLADIRDGLGPYLAIYLLTERKWDEASIGAVMSLAGVAGILAQTPAGALIDRSHAKRGWMAAAAVGVTAACLTLPFIDRFSFVAATQVVAHAAGSIFAPGIAALSLAGVAGIGLVLFAVMMPETAPYQGRSRDTSKDTTPRVMSGP